MKLKEVLKIRKNTIKVIEDELSRIQNKIDYKNNRIAKLNQEIKDSKMGEVKKYYEFLIFRDNIDNIKFEIEEEKSSLDNLYMQKSILDKKLKDAMIEYEKISFLHNQEIQENKKRMGRKEQIEMDDISGILQYTRRIK